MNAETLVRSHAAWALGRIGTVEAADALTCALASDPDVAVRTEIEQALMDLTRLFILQIFTVKTRWLSHVALLCYKMNLH